MCAIIGSFDKSKLKELYNLNAYRGALSYSVASFNLKSSKPENTELELLFKDDGAMPDSLIDNIPSTDGAFLIGHTQAPTTQTDNIHPAVYGQGLLWHNGIIKQKNISNETWDTEWLLQQIMDYGWSSLSRADGTFACTMYNGNDLYLFRNEISPLFVDDSLNISSTKFDGSYSLTPNTVYKINLESRTLTTTASFETLENPYYIPE